jgi:hypothetical protein
VRVVGAQETQHPVSAHWRDALLSADAVGKITTPLSEDGGYAVRRRDRTRLEISVGQGQRLRHRSRPDASPHHGGADDSDHEANAHRGEKLPEQFRPPAELIDALGITNVQDAAAWAPNGSGTPPEGNSQDALQQPMQFNIRGVNNNSGQQRNNYLTSGVIESYALERYDFGRSPNAALFNIGGGNALGGGLGAQTKRARYDRASDTVSYTGGSWAYKRAIVDINRPLTDKLAVRANSTLYIRSLTPAGTAALPFGNDATATGAPTATQSNNEVNLLNQINLPADRFNRALAGSKFRLPGERFSQAPDAPVLIQDTKDVNFALSHQVGENWFFEIGGDINKVANRSIRNGIAGGNSREVRIDINQLLPNGATNPHFLEPYNDMPFEFIYRNFLNRGLRGNAAYRLNAGKWGDYTFNLNLSSSIRTTQNRIFHTLIGFRDCPTVDALVFWRLP